MVVDRPLAQSSIHRRYTSAPGTHPGGTLHASPSHAQVGEDAQQSQQAHLRTCSDMLDIGERSKVKDDNLRVVSMSPAYPNPPQINIF